MELATKIPKRHEVDSESFLSNHKSSDGDVGDCGRVRDACAERAGACGLGAETVFVCLENSGQCPQEGCE